MKKREKKKAHAATWSVPCRECAEHGVHFMLPHCLSFVTCLSLSLPLSNTTLPKAKSSSNACASHVLFSLTLFLQPLNWGFAGPYHLHMHPLGKPFSPYTTLTTFLFFFSSFYPFALLPLSLILFIFLVKLSFYTQTRLLSFHFLWIILNYVLSINIYFKIFLLQIEIKEFYSKRN